MFKAGTFSTTCIYFLCFLGTCLVTKSCLLGPHGLQPARLLCPWDSPGKNTGVGCNTLLQRIFPTEQSNPFCYVSYVDSWGYMCVCVYIYVYVYIYMYMCIYIYGICVCIYIYIYTHTHTHTHILDVIHGKHFMTILNF